ncbi:MAG: Co2+/Mg2+ efflux protein ApaG [Pseudomonadota bacterium]
MSGPSETIGDTMAYEAVTSDIRVRVQPHYLEDQSDPALPRYVWAYEVEITNMGDKTVQLRERSWIILDANGKKEHVHGPGVVGEQPILNPGDTFRYSSGCPLATPSGFMNGVYHMVDEAGDPFDIDVPPFSLDLPDALGGGPSTGSARITGKRTLN